MGLSIARAVEDSGFLVRRRWLLLVLLVLLMLLVLLGLAIASNAVGKRTWIAWTCSTIVDRVIEESTDVMDKEGVKKWSNALLVGECKSSFVWNPIAMVS